MDTMRTSMRNGESLTQAATRVFGGTVDGVTTPGIMKATKAQASALAATSISAVTNEAALASFQANSDVIKAFVQLSTLDNKTSDICVAYSGQMWDINTLQSIPFPPGAPTLPFNGGPPRHFNCRSRLRPVTKSFKELGLDIEEFPVSTRASMDGQVPSDISFSDFLSSKPPSFADNLLGPKRANLWRNGDINLTQLVDFRGNPMTLAQLEQRLGIPPKVNPLAKVAPPKPKSKMVDGWLKNDDGTFVQITEVERANIRAHAKRLVSAAEDADAAVTKQVKALADDVGAKFPDAAIVKDGPLVEEGSLHWRMKDLDSTSRKIQTYARDRGITFTEAAEQISDSLRYTYVLSEDEYIKAIQEAMQKFAELGYKNNKFDPAWLLRDDYKGLNINLVSPQGVRMELQFHTAQSFEVKNGINHTLYEKFRVLSKAKQVGPEGQALQAEMLANAQAIPVPKNIQFLEDLAKIYNKPNPARQKEIFEQAKKRQLAAQKKFKAAQKKEADRKAKEAALMKEPIEVTRKRLLTDMGNDYGWLPEDADLVKEQIKELLKKGNGITPRDRAGLHAEWRMAMKKKQDELAESAAKIKAEREALEKAAAEEKAAGLAKAEMTEAEAVKSALKGEFLKAGESQAVIDMHVDAYSNAPSYIKSVIGQRKPLKAFVQDYVLKDNGAFYRNYQNEVWIHAGSHDVRIGLNATWRHEYGHAIDFDLAERFYRLSGMDLATDKSGIPIISRAFNKSLLADSKRFQRWKGTGEDSVKYDRLVTKLQTESFQNGREKYFNPLLKKHGMTYDQVIAMAKRNFNLTAGHKFDNYVDDFFIPNMLASIETGNVQGFLNAGTTGFFKGGGDLASMSDYIGSITKNKVRGNWGHSDAYYSAARHGASGKHKEAFANFFGMMGGEDRLFFEALLRSWGTDKYLKDLIKAMKLLEKG